MTTVIAINGSPRKKGNTSALLDAALQGAAETGAETEMIHLYDLDFKGCVSCFACKLRDGKSFGRCARRDGLTPVLERVLAARAVFIGSPIYFADVTGETRSFLERLAFPVCSYDDESFTYFPGRLNLGFIYTMNVDRETMKDEHYDMLFAWHFKFKELFGGRFEYISSNDTMQFDDYSLYAADMFDEDEKAAVKARQFPLDLERARSLGESLATE